MGIGVMVASMALTHEVGVQFPYPQPEAIRLVSYISLHDLIGRRIRRVHRLKSDLWQLDKSLGIATLLQFAENC